MEIFLQDFYDLIPFNLHSTLIFGMFTLLSQFIIDIWFCRVIEISNSTHSPCNVSFSLLSLFQILFLFRYFIYFKYFVVSFSDFFLYYESYSLKIFNFAFVLSLSIFILELKFICSIILSRYLSNYFAENFFMSLFSLALFWFFIICCSTSSVFPFFI